MLLRRVSIIVEKPIYDEVLAGVSEFANKIKLGRGLNPDPDMGQRWAGGGKNDIAKAHRAAHQLRAGTVWINGYNVFELRYLLVGTSNLAGAAKWVTTPWTYILRRKRFVSPFEACPRIDRRRSSKEQNEKARSFEPPGL